MVEPDGNIQLCCNSVKKDDPANIVNLDVSNILNNHVHTRVRKDMLEGKLPSECERCWKSEELGIKSFRQQQNLTYLKYFPKMLNSSSAGKISSGVKYLDVRFNNTCNLKCVMCSSGYSSLWVEEEKTLQPLLTSEEVINDISSKISFYDKDRFKWGKDTDIVNTILKNASTLERLHFAGGEPLLSKQHNELLKDLIGIGVAKQLFLSYNTNGEYITEELLELWGQFKKVKIFYSLDHIEDKNEYIRFPSKWKTVQEKFELIESCSPNNIHWRISSTLSALNVAYLPEFVEWKIEQNFKKIHSRYIDGKLFHGTLLEYPKYLNPDVLPLEVKEQIRSKFNNYRLQVPLAYRRGYDKLVRDTTNFMFSSDNSHRLPALKDYLEGLDKIRGTSFRETFPIFKGII
jgi:MoaA/NifB/PqqE/SkfB family radical SAM enzyme